MEPRTLSALSHVFQDVAGQPDWLTALDALFVAMRGDFIFDNVAIFLPDQTSSGTDVVYARAVGRGRTAEADAAWGQELAAQVLATQQTVARAPSAGAPQDDRLKLAHLLGLPLRIGWRPGGALVFTRFGGPAYTEEHIGVATLLACWSAALIAQRELQQARQQLESVQRQMRLQDDFVSTISHELRTPLGFIKGYSTSLLRLDTTWDAATQREFLAIIDEESDRLTNLIDNMLESARLQSRTILFKFAPLRLDSLAREVAARVGARQPGLQIEFDCEPLPALIGDSQRLSQVFENLFSNAIKYAPESRITIRMRREPQAVHATFSDRGQGIAQEFLPFLFERFYRVPGDQGVTGTGLGLYICKQIVLAHRGKIWAESDPDQGTAFHIELPLPDAA